MAPVAVADAPRDLQSTYAATHVVKRFSATQPGALKLARRFGDALVCVRYRHDPEGRYRYTTVELVVDEAPVERRADLDATVMVHLAFNDTGLQQLARARRPMGQPPALVGHAAKNGKEARTARTHCENMTICSNQQCQFVAADSHL